MFQAVKHHCANMCVATEMATAAVWDAANAAESGGDQLRLRGRGRRDGGRTRGESVRQSQHAGARRHRDHVGARRPPLHAPGHVAAQLPRRRRRRRGPRRAGAQRRRAGEGDRAAARSRGDPQRGARLRRADQGPAGRRAAHTDDRDRLRDAALAQAVRPRRRRRRAARHRAGVHAAGVKRPQYGITAWVILTLIQHANEDQVDRWVLPALHQEVIWCQLFSEPDAGSDAAGIKTRATRVDGGWLVNGQKVWTSGAHYSGFGFATVRTNPDVPKHEGITMMVIDMHGEGVEVRPLKMTTGNSEFNEVFFNDVFVPDDDVVGPVDGGWTVARATLGNESVSIGGGTGGMSIPAKAIVDLYDQHAERLAGGAPRVGRYVADSAVLGLLNLRARTGPSPRRARDRKGP